MAAATDRVKQILSWYSSDNVGVKTNLARLMNHGALAGTGKFVILPVDQGFEHGPARSFAPNPAGVRPRLPLPARDRRRLQRLRGAARSLEASADRFAGQMPTILKLNNSDSLAKMDEPCSAVTASVKDAVRLGCSAIGYTIYPGLGARNPMYEELRDLIARGEGRRASDHRVGLPARRGPLEGRRDGHRRHRLLGAHRLRARRAHRQGQAAEGLHRAGRGEEVFEKYAIPTKTLTDRVKHVVQSCFNGKRIVIFSGGEAKGTDEVLDEVRGMAAGGGFGSIMGRNAFQRPHAEALKLLSSVMESSGRPAIVRRGA